MKKYILSIVLAFTMSFCFSQESKTSSREFYLIQIYHCTSNQQIKGVDSYLQNTYLPYLHKSGIKKVGVFAPIANDTATDKKLYVWIPMKSLNVLDKLDQGIEQLDPFGKNEIVDLENADSSLPYTRIERIVAKAFKYQSQFEKTSNLTKSPDRIYEYRSYESPTENAHLRKVHMFNEGGEITLFKRLNFNAIFYSKAIVGDRLPNLIYITSFNNMADRDAHWKAFSASPEWQSISNMPKYAKSVNRNETVLMTARMYADF
jgi:phosphorylcholine metabolism protein LicD